MEQLNTRRFTTEHSTMLKGIAVLLLMCHHILNQKYVFESVIPTEMMKGITSVAKVCVSIFFILSGYGLYRSYWKKADNNDLKFIADHILKLLCDFWFIYILFVPLGIIFGRFPSEIYGEHYVCHFLIDFLGAASLFATPSMNPTWWFLSFILLFYLISPLLFRMIKRAGNKSIIYFFGVMIISLFYYGYRGVLVYFVPYLAGIVLSECNLFEKMYFRDREKKYTVSIISILIAIITVYVRQGYFMNDPKYYKMDWLLGVIIIFLAYRFIDRNSKTANALMILGQHSYNIFLFHSFLYSLYFRDMLYSLKYALFIYIVFIVMCLIISILIEKMKETIRWNRSDSVIVKNKSVSIGLTILWFMAIVCSYAPYEIAKIGLGTFRITTKELPIQVGQSRRISYENRTLFREFATLHWESSNTEIVNVSQQGVFTAVKVGQADVYLDIGMKKLKYHIIVKP